MNTTQIRTRKRVNIILPRATLSLVDRVIERGDRSRFIDEAVRFYVKEKGRANLKKLVQKGALARAGRDREIAEDWFMLENEVWPNKN